jgi:C4-type Zn-finger protein
MKILEVLSTHRNDFTARMECEHCGSKQKLSTGYNDANYHERVIPGLRCETCGKNRAGEVAPVTA